MSYAITPSSFSYYSFSPSSTTYTNTQTEQDNQNFTRVDNAPVLSWAGGAGYVSDYVQPDYGSASTSFVYRVKYTDAENDPPAYVKLYIANNGIAISGSPFSMTAENPNNTNYIAGNIYTFPTNLPESNNYTYSIRTFLFQQ